MAQMKLVGYTNDAILVARHEVVGFTANLVIVTNIWEGKQYHWDSTMPDGWYVKTAGGITTSNGVSRFSMSTAVGAAVSSFTNANPGVITVNDTGLFDFEVGDTIKVYEVADDNTGTNSLNNSFTIASMTVTTITLVEDTSTTGYSIYVSGGKVVRERDPEGIPVATDNAAILGITLGTDVVGYAGKVASFVAFGENAVD